MNAEATKFPFQIYTRNFYPFIAESPPMFIWLVVAIWEKQQFWNNGLQLFTAHNRNNVWLAS